MGTLSTKARKNPGKPESGMFLLAAGSQATFLQWDWRLSNVSHWSRPPPTLGSHCPFHLECCFLPSTLHEVTCLSVHGLSVSPSASTLAWVYTISLSQISQSFKNNLLLLISLEGKKAQILWVQIHKWQTCLQTIACELCMKMLVAGMRLHCYVRKTEMNGVNFRKNKALWLHLTFKQEQSINQG